MRDNAKITYMYANAQITDMYGNAQITDMYGNAQITYMYGNAQITDMYGNAKITTISNFATVQKYGILYVAKNCQVNFTGTTILSSDNGLAKKAEGVQ
jgi:hypothetical protein